MLQTAAGEPVVTITNLLKEIEPDKPTGFKAVLESHAVLAAMRRSRSSRPGLTLVVHAACWPPWA